MEYRVCVAVESDSIPTQIVNSIAKRYKNGVLPWNNVFVWLLSQTQYPDKSYIPLQNAKTNGILQWNIVFVRLLSQTQYPHKSYIP